MSVTSLKVIAKLAVHVGPAQPVKAEARLPLAPRRNVLLIRNNTYVEICKCVRCCILYQVKEKRLETENSSPSHLPLCGNRKRLDLTAPFATLYYTYVELGTSISSVDG